MLVSVWDAIQTVLGAPDFKKKLYTSVLGNQRGKLLDFGCADGHIADAFGSFEYYGIDIDDRFIQSASRRFAGVPNMQFLCADLKSRPFGENFFDQVLFATTAHHLSDDMYVDMLHELHYCLKPGGTIHVLDPVFREKDGWQERLLRSMDRGRFPRTTNQLIDLIPPGCFEVGSPTWHAPYGALIQDCDFVHLPLTKLS
jgi:SAM-dependent methyltransferase